jgi:hypothetical protein
MNWASILPPGRRAYGGMPCQYRGPLAAALAITKSR